MYINSQTYYADEAKKKKNYANFTGADTFTL